MSAESRQPGRMGQFLRQRLWGVVDNLLAPVVVVGVGAIAPLVAGIVLGVGLETLAIVVLCLSQLVISGALLLTRRRLLVGPRTKESLAVDGATGEVYLVDRFGLPHLVSDDDTALYFMESLGYEREELAQVGSADLRPVGAPVTAMRGWRRPRTELDSITHEARSSLNYRGKKIVGGDDARAVAFEFRNDADQRLYIRSAQLFMEPTAPFTLADISGRNRPAQRGLASCVLLFSGTAQSGELAPGEEACLWLVLERALGDEDMDRIVRVPYGYIAFEATFKESRVEFQKSV